jgi:hypothetical protein
MFTHPRDPQPGLPASATSNCLARGLAGECPGESQSVACTVITPDYLPWALTLGRSLARHGRLGLAVLVVDGDRRLDLGRQQAWLDDRGYDLRLCSLAELSCQEATRSTAARHAENPDYLRWSLKSLLCLHLLATHRRVLFCDCDLYFFQDYGFILRELDHADVLLTPHWRSIWPVSRGHAGELINALTDGIFNAGFLGATRGAAEFLSWWNYVCTWSCRHDRSRGMYADQRYLDLAPVYFADRCRVLEHRGCNVAIWNTRENRRQRVGQEVLINGHWPIVFMHLTQQLVQCYRQADPDLIPYVEHYLAELEWTRATLARDCPAIV